MNQSNLLTVRVAGVMNRQAVVLHAGRTLPCLLSGRLLRQKDSLAVGDRAEAEVLGGGQYRLTRILPRTSALRRPSRRGSGDALLAANADFVLAVCAAPSLLRAFTLPEWALEAARAASSAHSGRVKARSREGAAHTASTKSALAARRASPEPRRLGRRRALVRGRMRVRRYWPPPRTSASARSPTARLSFCRSSRPDSRQGRVRPAWSTTACRFMTPATRTVRRLDWFMGILPRFRAHCSRAGRAEATAKTVPQKSCAGACFAPAQDYGSSRPRRPRVRIRWMLFGARK